jgi:hypothetical protein
MTSFDDRQKAQENKYAHEEELKFKSRARAAKLLGQWAATNLGVPADAYAAELINLTTSGKPESALIKKVHDDMVAAGKDLSLDLIGEKYNRCLSEAKEQVLKS